MRIIRWLVGVLTSADVTNVPMGTFNQPETRDYAQRAAYLASIAREEF